MVPAGTTISPIFVGKGIDGDPGNVVEFLSVWLLEVENFAALGCMRTAEARGIHLPAALSMSSQFAFHDAGRTGYPNSALGSAKAAALDKYIASSCGVHYSDRRFSLEAN